MVKSVFNRVSRLGVSKITGVISEMELEIITTQQNLDGGVSLCYSYVVGIIYFERSR